MILRSLAVTLFLLAQAPAKGTIDGTVVNSATGEPITGAQVTLMEMPPGEPGPGGGIVGGTITGVQYPRPAEELCVVLASRVPRLAQTFVRDSLKLPLSLLVQ